MTQIKIDTKNIDMIGRKIFVKIWEPAEKVCEVPIVLLHDSLGSVEQWRDFPANLCKRLNRKIIAYDRVGYGRSSELKDLPSINFVTNEAETTFPVLKNALNIQNFILFGHSMGGAIAAEIAARHPKQCRTLFLEAAPVFVESKTLEGIRTAQMVFEDRDQFDRLRKYHGEKTEWVLSARTDIWLSPFFKDWNIFNALKRVSCPVLAIYGSKDEYSSEAFPEEICKKVGRRAEKVVLKGRGHFPHREDEISVFENVEKFLGKTSVRRRVSA